MLPKTPTGVFETRCFAVYSIRKVRTLVILFRSFEEVAPSKGTS